MKKELIHFVLALVIALIAIGAYFLACSLVSKAQQSVALAAGQVSAIQKEDAAISAAKGALAALTADEVAVEGYLVSPDDIVAFLEGLEATGESLGATVEVASVSAVGSDKRIELAVRIEGTFAAVMRTLGAIEYGPHDLRTKQLILDTIPSDPTAPWSAAVTFSAATPS